MALPSGLLPRIRDLTTSRQLSKYIRQRKQGVAQALARVRDRLGRSPEEAVAALLTALTHADNGGNPWDDSGMVAAHLEALGHLAPATPQARVFCRQAPSSLEVLILGSNMALPQGRLRRGCRTSRGTQQVLRTHTCAANDVAAAERKHFARFGPCGSRALVDKSSTTEQVMDAAADGDVAAGDTRAVAVMNYTLKLFATTSAKLQGPWPHRPQVMQQLVRVLRRALATRGGAEPHSDWAAHS